MLDNSERKSLKSWLEDTANASFYTEGFVLYFSYTQSLQANENGNTEKTKQTSWSQMQAYHTNT